MNGEKKAASSREPSEVELLLPWHAAGALGSREAQAVEAALANDPELALRYEWVREELAQETLIGDTLGEPPAHDVEALFARIDALPPRRAASNTIAARFAELFASLSPRALAWSAMAAAVVIVLQAAVIAGILLNANNGVGYQTASEPTNITDQGSDVLLRFKPQASADQIADFLASNKLSIVGGPFAGGLYRVRVAPTKLAKADLSRVIDRLQNDQIVGFIAAAE